MTGRWITAAWEGAALVAVVGLAMSTLKRVDRGGRPEDMAGRTMVLLLATLIGMGLVGSMTIALAGSG